MLYDKYLASKVKSCYNPLRLGTVIVLVFSGIDFVNTPRLYSDRDCQFDHYSLCQREPKVPGLYKKHTVQIHHFNFVLRFYLLTQRHTHQ